MIDMGLERKLLGALILGGSLGHHAQGLHEDDFAEPAHRRAYRAICAILAEGNGIDEGVLASRCPEFSTQIDGWVECCATPENAQRWAAEIRKLAASRRSVAAADRIAQLLRDGKDPHAAVAELERNLSDRSVQAALDTRAVGHFWDLSTPPPGVPLLLETLGEPKHGVEPVGVYPAGFVGMLAAEGGAGKTWALIQLAVSIAAGNVWLDAFRPLRQGRVLMLLGEEPGREIERRLKHAIAHMDRSERAAVAKNVTAISLAGQNAAFVRIDRIGNPETTDFFHTVMSAINGESWELIIVDPLSRFACQGVETDAALATQFVACLERLLRAPGNPSVIVSHHTNKASRGGMVTNAGAARGSSALTDGVRWQANLENIPVFPGVPEMVMFRVTKGNPCGKPPGVMLARDGTRGGALRRARHAEAEAYLEAKRQQKDDR